MGRSSGAGRLAWTPAIVLPVLAGLFASACSATARLPVPAAIEDRSYGASILTPKGSEMGVASWYGPGFHGRKTASGEIYDQDGLTAAHRTLPLGTRVSVRDMRSNRTVQVRINDRGPYADGRIIDLSKGAAKALGIVESGTTPVEITIVESPYEGFPRVLHSVQVGAYSTRAMADRMGLKAASRGYHAYLKILASKPVLYGVRVGPYSDRSAAKTTARDLKRDGFDTVVVDEDPRTASYLMKKPKATAQLPVAERPNPARSAGGQ